MLDAPAKTAHQRRLEILRLLRRENSVAVSHLARRFGVSEMTVRRDLSALEREGRVIRTYGGGVSTETVAFEFSFAEKMQRNTAAKERIGRTAAGLVRPGETVLLDTGTTTLQVARFLPDSPDITVVTTSLPIVSALFHKRVRVTLPGGDVRRRTPDIYGPLTESNLEDIHVDRAFLGADGLDVEAGLSTTDMSIARISRLMLQAARQAVVVLDSSKIGRICFARYAALSEIDLLVTDEGLSRKDRRAVERAGVKVMIARRAGRKGLR